MVVELHETVPGAFDAVHPIKGHQFGPQNVAEEGDLGLDVGRGDGEVMKAVGLGHAAFLQAGGAILRRLSRWVQICGISPRPPEIRVLEDARGRHQPSSKSMTNAPSLRPGDRLPDFALPGLDRKLRKFVWSFVGDPVALIVTSDLNLLDADQFGALRAACQQASVALVVATGTDIAAAGAIWKRLVGAEDGPYRQKKAKL